MLGQPRHQGHPVPDAAPARRYPAPPPRPMPVAAAPDRIWKQMPSGRMVDLMAPHEAVIDFAGDIAPALSFIARFDGACAVGGRAWTVLDHTVAGHDIIRGLAGDRFATLWLLHDLHEAYIGDITTPASHAIAATARREHPDKTGYDAGYYVTSAIRSLKASWDAAIFAAAGVSRAEGKEVADLHTFDARMMMTERRHMMAPPGHGWGALERLPSFKTVGKLRPHRQPDRLITAFLDQLDARCPAARPRASLEDLARFTQL